MTDRDEWGRDPAVKGMRSVFKEMESRQRRLLKQLEISMVDPRLRHWREQALVCFNKAWARAGGTGIPMDISKAGAVYIAGLVKILQLEGVVLSDKLLSLDADIEMLFKEAGA